MNENGFFDGLKRLLGPKGKPAAVQAPASEAREREPVPVPQTPAGLGSKETVLGPGFAAKQPGERHEIVSGALEQKRAGLETLEREQDWHARAAEFAQSEGEHEDAEKIRETMKAIRGLIEAERKHEEELLKELERLTETHPELARPPKKAVAATEAAMGPRTGAGKTVAPPPMQAEPVAADEERGHSKLERMLAEHPKLSEAELREAEEKVLRAAEAHEVEPEPLTEEERKGVLGELHSLSEGKEITEKAGQLTDEVKKNSYHPAKEKTQTESEGIDFRELSNLKKKEEIKSVMKDIERHRIVTDYDKILNYLRAHNKAKILEMANALHVERTQIMEHVKTLEDSGLIEIVYPPIGAPIVVYKKAKETEEG